MSGLNNFKTNKIMEEQGLGIALILCFIIVPILSEILSKKQ
jgi:hypothetical protein